MSDINDIRGIKDFRTFTFSCYKKTDVRKTLIEVMNNGDIERACYWSAEFICAGQYLDLWEIIILFVGKHIHLGNPKLPVYIDRRFQTFVEIVRNGYSDNELMMRNNQKIRALFAEIIGILCLSKKKPKLEKNKIAKREFNITEMNHKFRAPSPDFASRFIRPKDSHELIIPLNELAYNISDTVCNLPEAMYWVDWMHECMKIIRKKREMLKCERREFAVNVDPKLQFDAVWLIWEVILDQSANRSELVNRIITSIFNIYCVKFTEGVRNKRVYLIYFAISLLTENVDFKIDVVGNMDIIRKIVGNINVVYKQVKQNEDKPNTDYLFNGVKNTNLESSIAKMEMLKNLEFVPHSNDSNESVDGDD